MVVLFKLQLVLLPFVWGNEYGAGQLTRLVTRLVRSESRDNDITEHRTLLISANGVFKERLAAAARDMPSGGDTDDDLQPGGDTDNNCIAHNMDCAIFKGGAAIVGCCADMRCVGQGIVGICKPPCAPSVCLAASVGSVNYSYTAGSSDYGDDVDVCCSQTCSGFADCPFGQILVPNPTAITGFDVSSCCVQACNVFDCQHAGSVQGLINIFNASQFPGSNESTCCTKPCSWYPCRTNYLRKYNAAYINDIGIHDVCCEPACSGFPCPDGYLWKSGYDQIHGNDLSLCCDQTCKNYVNCPNVAPARGWLLNASANTIRAFSDSSCCAQACTFFSSCTANTLLKDNAAAVIGNSQSDCCVAACSAYLCPTNYVFISNAAATIGNSRDVCCVKACGGFTCPDGYLWKSLYGSIPGNSRDVCCDQTCKYYADCPNVAPATGWLLSPSATTIRGFSRSLCCVQACTFFSCAANFLLKATAAAVIGNDQGLCCDPACSAPGYYTCPANQLQVASPSITRGNDLTTCCTAACSGYTCPSGFGLVDDRLTKRGNTQALCCYQLMCSAYTSCPTNYKQVDGAATYPGYTQNTCCVQVTCRCDTPNKGTSNNNRYTCTDGIYAWCASTQACTRAITDSWLKTDVGSACKVPTWRVINGACGRDADQGCISSPNYGNNRQYSNLETCTIDVQYGQPIQLMAFSTESCCDKLTVNRQSFSGTSTVGLNGITPENGASISWSSDYSIVSTGWKICMPQR